MDKTILYNLSYGLYVIGVSDGQKPTGCIINTCIQVTSQNPIIAISMNRNNYTFEAIRKSGKFSVSIIAEESDRSVITSFGFRSGYDCNKYDGYEYDIIESTPVLKGRYAGQMICEVLDMVENETHFVIFARVTDTLKGESLKPMTYEYYHKVVKGKAPKNAPTYREEELTETKDSVQIQTGGERYVCPVCGYVYEGDITTENDDFVCPVCALPKTSFEAKQ